MPEHHQEDGEASQGVNTDGPARLSDARDLEIVADSVGGRDKPGDESAGALIARVG